MMHNKKQLTLDVYPRSGRVASLADFLRRIECARPTCMHTIAGLASGGISPARIRNFSLRKVVYETSTAAAQ